MGGDGGQVVDRATMVKTRGYGFTKETGGRYSASLGEMSNYVQMVSEDKGLTGFQRHEHRMTTCHLSQEPLQEPVVACRLGNLYNKEAVLRALLDGGMPEGMSHIRGLKDLKQCLLTWSDKGPGDAKSKHLLCPITRSILDAGASRAVLIWTSGAVVSPKALQELSLKECPISGVSFDARLDVIPFAPCGEELAALQARLPAKKRRRTALDSDVTSSRSSQCGRHEATVSAPSPLATIAAA